MTTKFTKEWIDMARRSITEPGVERYICIPVQEEMLDEIQRLQVENAKLEQENERLQKVIDLRDDAIESYATLYDKAAALCGYTDILPAENEKLREALEKIYRLYVQEEYHLTALKMAKVAQQALKEVKE